MTAEHEKASLASIGKDISTEKADQLEAIARSPYANVGVSAEEAAFFDDFTDSNEHKKLLRKNDLRLVPLLALLYLVAHIDRANIGNAKIEGMEEDLKLTGYQYNIALVKPDQTIVLSSY